MHVLSAASPTFQLQSTNSSIVVIKLGTSSIINETTCNIRHSIISDVASTVATLRLNGLRVVLVSSGAVGLGLHRLGYTMRPDSIPKQAFAAIGQGELISMWSTIFAKKGLAVSQVLLSHDDVSSPHRRKHVIRTLRDMSSLGVVPIINENDTLSTQETRIGDNDTLSAILAVMINASYLFLLTDVDSLYAANPRYVAHASRIDEVSSISALRVKIDFANLDSGSANGTGGMVTKLRAAEIASAAGISTVIASSSRPSLVSEILEYYSERGRDSVDALIPTCFPKSANSSDHTTRPTHTLISPDPTLKLPSFLESFGC